MVSILEAWEDFSELLSLKEVRASIITNERFLGTLRAGTPARSRRILYVVRSLPIPTSFTADNVSGVSSFIRPYPPPIQG